MIVHYDLSLEHFQAWSGGKDTLNDLSPDDCKRLEQHLTELYPDGMTDSQLNDFLWFERDMIADLLGYRNADAMFSHDPDSWEEHYTDLLQDRFCEKQDLVEEFVDDECDDGMDDDEVIEKFKEWLKEREEEDEE